METRERVISVTLNESDWQAFVERHPQPVVWLRERIQQAIGDRQAIAASAATAAANTTSATTR